MRLSGKERARMEAYVRRLYQIELGLSKDGETVFGHFILGTLEALDKLRDKMKADLTHSMGRPGLFAELWKDTYPRFKSRGISMPEARRQVSQVRRKLRAFLRRERRT